MLTAKVIVTSVIVQTNYGFEGDYANLFQLKILTRFNSEHFIKFNLNDLVTLLNVVHLAEEPLHLRNKSNVQLHFDLKQSQLEYNKRSVLKQIMYIFAVLIFIYDV